jgi:hypothetical protein
MMSTMGRFLHRMKFPGGEPDSLRCAPGYARTGILAIYFYKCLTIVMPREWSLLTNHGRVLLCIARNPDARLRDIANEIGITERTAYGIVAELTDAGYVVKTKHGRRNRYEVQQHLPLREPVTPERTVGEVLRVLVDAPRPRTTRPTRR